MITEGRGVHSRMELDGLKLTIEVPAGGSRTGVNKAGERWENKVTASYGYILGTHSPDGEHLDCWVRRSPKKNAEVYVVHQLSVDGSKFDEDKVMLGYSSEKEAVDAFKANCFKPASMYGGVSTFGLEHFKVIAFQASRSKAMLASEKNFHQFKSEGLLPAGIKSPIQVAQKVSESMEATTSPMIAYATMVESATAFDLAQRNGLETHRDGRSLYFAEGKDLETFIDIVDHHQLPRELLGDLHEAAVKESAIMEAGMGDALGDMESEYKPGTDLQALAADVAKDYGLDATALAQAFVRRHGSEDAFLDKKAATARSTAAKNAATQQAAAAAPTLNNIVDALSNTIGDQFPDGNWQDAADRVRRKFRVAPDAWSKQWPKIQKAFLQSYGGSAKNMDDYMRRVYDDMKGEAGFDAPNPYREGVEETNTDDVFFQQQIQEMRALAGIRNTNVNFGGTPVVHSTKKLVESINSSFRNAYKSAYMDHAATARVKRMDENEQYDSALRLVALTQAANPTATYAGITDAVSRKVFETLSEVANIGRYITESTGMEPAEFSKMFAEQEVDEKFNKAAHGWVKQRAAELYPKVVKDKGAAFARAWVEYKQKH